MKTKVIICDPSYLQDKIEEFFSTLRGKTITPLFCVQSQSEDSEVRMVVWSFIYLESAIVQSNMNIR